MDHSTKELEGVVSRLTQQFADRLQEWVQEVSESQDVNLEALEDKVQGG